LAQKLNNEVYKGKQMAKRKVVRKKSC